MDLNSIKNRYGIIGTSSALNHAIETAVSVAKTDLSVLITGESGVGKEFFPKIIHDNSNRKNGKYIAINCGSIPEGTIESELFGHEKGAFTGAVEAHKGYFEEANGGTLFLDEVAELPITTQVRLLRVLQNGEFIRVGSAKAQKTDVRVIAATNVDLIEAINSGKFRNDLYYRLNIVPIYIPPLRERKEDIGLLFRKFTGDVSSKYGFKPILLDDNAKSLLMNYSWPGNIRQLENISKQIATLEQGKTIDSAILKTYIGGFGNEELPVLRTEHQREHSGENTERDILYKLLFDLKGEVDELKSLIKQMQNGEMPSVQNIVETPQINTTHSAAVETTWSEVEEVLEEAQDKLPTTKAEMQKKMIEKALAKCGGNRRQAAKELFMSERTLYRKIKQLGIEP